VYESVEHIFVLFVESDRDFVVNKASSRALLILLSEELESLLSFGSINPVVVLLIMDRNELVLDKLPEESPNSFDYLICLDFLLINNW
jgi:hypothetical protein